MSVIAAPEQVQRIVENQHQNPFEVLGAHFIHGPHDTGCWIVRAFLPEADAAWVIHPATQVESTMASVHHPHFFECLLETKDLPRNYLLKVKQGDRNWVMHDPYAFKPSQLSNDDLHLFGEGKHHRIYDKLGAHLIEMNGVSGVYFAVWAPNARNVSVIGDFNGWDGRRHQMRLVGGGIWDLFIPALTPGETYKYEIKNQYGHLFAKADPYGFHHEVRPATASMVATLDYQWHDQTWLARRDASNPQTEPISIYEVHLGSWLHSSGEHPPSSGQIVHPSDKPEARFLTYRELADKLIPYVKKLGYTHIEVLPVAEHPYDGSWGYQVTGYYAPTSRYGTPQDFMYFVDQCHQNEIGILVDWVPGHFPKDAHGLAFFDGTHLYEHADPRIGEHKEWGTLVFNYARNEVQNFLIANALFWFDKYHIDGIRVDAVASMLYLDYDRDDGEWIPNVFGGREHLEVVDFLKTLNTLIFQYYPGVISVAEESTAWPNVSRPTYVGGLGFNLKWNMGWMHDMLDYFSKDPVHRRYHQNNVTFSIWYAFSENFMLALSHDEVVHGKGNLINKMPGDDWQKFANLRALYGYMFTHPGKKTLFMGMEFGQIQEWSVWRDLDWHLLNNPHHQALQQFMMDLNGFYKQHPALYTDDFSDHGFEWIDCSDVDHSVVSFLRKDKHSDDFLVVVCNFTPGVYGDYWIGVPQPGVYQEIFNSDARYYGGSDVRNAGDLLTRPWEHNHRWPHALSITLPPLSMTAFQLTSS